MNIIWDATGERMYPVGRDGGLTSGSVVMVRKITEGLAERGHTVHVVTNDLEREEQRGPSLWYWGPKAHPTRAEVVVFTHQVTLETDYNYDKLVLAHTGCQPYLGPSGEWASQIDAWPVFTEAHRDLLLQYNPLVERDRTFVTGLGVDYKDYLIGGARLALFDPKYHDCPVKTPGRLFFANDPMRGLKETLDVFDLVRKAHPEATLHVGYDFDSQLERVRYEHSYRAQVLLECAARMAATPGVVKLPALSREDLVREELETVVHVYPSDPANPGTQTHGILQMELAAAGAALVLSDVEAFPELFGDCAVILPRVGKYVPQWERRVSAEDYASATCELLENPVRRLELSQAARKVAEENSWEAVIDRWCDMLEVVTQGEEVASVSG